MSEHEMDPLVRLRAANPAAGATYAHPDAAAMLARITGVELAPRVGLARGFRLRVASAAAAAALVTAGGIAVIQAAAPGLSALSLSGAALHTDLAKPAGSPASFQYSSVAAGQAIPEAKLVFVAGPHLSNAALSAPSYDLTPAGNFATLSERIATALGVSGTLSSTPGADASWTIGTAPGGSVRFATNDAVLSWSFSSSLDGGFALPPYTGTALPSPDVKGSVISSNAKAVADAESVLRAAGVGGSFGEPVVTRHFVGANKTVAITVPWAIGVPGDPFHFSATYDTTGQLLFASGVDVTVTRGATYPLLMPVAGVRLLQSQQNEYAVNPGGLLIPVPTPASVPPNQPVAPTTINPGGPMVPAPSASTGPLNSSSLPTEINSGGYMIPASLTSTSTDTPTTLTINPSGPLVPVTEASNTTSSKATKPPTVTSVVLRSVSIQYAEYTLSGGAAVLLPQFLYTATNGSQWVLLAVQPAYVRVATPSGDSGGTVHPAYP